MCRAPLRHKICIWVWGHPLSTYAKFYEKLTRRCAYQARNVSFSEKFAYELNGWPLYRSVVSKSVSMIKTLCKFTRIALFHKYFSIIFLQTPTTSLASFH